MADIKTRVLGDSSSGVNAMNEMGDAVGKSAAKWTLMADAVKGAAKATLDFLVESVKKSADSERGFRQLQRAAGDYADSIDAQSKALSKLYAVDDDVINQSAVLLTQWGGVGAATKNVETAALNLAAAMGGDLNTATQDLIRNVESGGTSLGKMGVHFKVTGDRGKDLEAAVAAINEKFGGAAGADAQGLTGQVRMASIAFEDIQKTIGGAIGKFLEQSGATNALVRSMQLLNQVMGGDREHEQQIAFLKLRAAQLDLNQKQQAASSIATSGAPQSMIDFFVAEVDKAQAKVNELKASVVDVVSAVPAVTGTTNKGLKNSANDKTQEQLNDESLKAAKDYYDGIETLAENARVKEEADYAEELQMSANRVKLAIKEGDDKTAALQLSIAKDNELYAKQEKYRDAAAARFLKDSNDANAARLTSQVESWNRAGEAIGNAFVSALGDQLNKLAAGEEFDVAVFVGDILASVIAVAGTVIGTAYGQPALGAAVGNLAAMGVRAGAGAISASNKKERAKSAKKYHSGGWVGDEQIGSDEQRAILQTGERVLTGNEVHHMGGRNSVDAMAKGRGMGGPTINNYIKAIDSKNAAESFMADLGQGLKRALRTGQGDVPRLLGVSPR